MRDKESGTPPRPAARDRVSRREWVRRVLVAAAPLQLAAAGRRCVLRNRALELAIAVGGGKVVSRRLTNRLTGETLVLPPEEFALEFEDGYQVASADLKAEIARADAAELELLFSGERLQVRVRHQLPAGKPYLRKQVSLRRRGGASLRLRRADLDNWRGVRRNWRSMTADRLSYGSHPVYCETWWAGVEFVAAFNEYGGDGFLLRSRPGGPEITGDWLDLRPTVAGVAVPGGVREAFLAYLEDVRLAPPRLVACYNSWWTLPKVVVERDNLALIRELRAALYERYGVFFDLVTTDMGWSNPRSIWEIDRSILPAGFDDIRAIVEPAGGKLGIWMSPSEQYPPVCDYDWAEKNGYIVLRPEAGRRGGPAVSLADPRYREGTKAALKKLIRENGLGHVKYDGFHALESKPHHGLRPGEDSVEPLAEYSLELLKASKEENPELVTEPTYLNSLANYISPWILRYSDTIWGNSGGDCPPGLGPAPDYRESQTNAREFYIFSSLNEVWAPQNALHYFDIVHVDAREGFPNHAAMAFARGRFFVSTYLNPKVMNEEDWRVYAGLLRWARANRDLLRHTRVLPSRVEAGEPYSYAHWRGRRGILAVRNPANEDQEITLDLEQAGAPKTLRQAVCYTQYPYRKGIAAGLDGGSRIRLRLAPWELLFLEIAPRAELAETVVIGARWYREPGGDAWMAPDDGVESVRVIEAGGRERIIPVRLRRRGQLGGELISQAVRPLAESEWLAGPQRRSAAFPFHYPAEFGSEEIRKLEQAERGEKRFPSVAFDLECAVSAPPAAKSMVLLLVEYPGREYRPSRCAARVDGRPVALRENNSSGHVGYYVAAKDNFWKDILPHESEWCWYICEVDGGKHQVRFSGQAGHPTPRLGLWAWAEFDLKAARVPLPAPSSEAAMPQYRAETERRGVCLKRPRPDAPARDPSPVRGLLPA